MELQIDSIKTLDLPDARAAIDRLEEDISNHPLAIYDLPVKNVFTDHLYCRRFFMPAGTLLTSEIHLTEHQFVIPKGVVAVWTPETKAWTRHDAPDAGITKPGTRRVLFAFEDTCWFTYHVLTDEENQHRNVDRILERLIDQPHRAKHHQKKEQLVLCQ